MSDIATSDSVARLEDVLRKIERVATDELERYPTCHGLKVIVVWAREALEPPR